MTGVPGIPSGNPGCRCHTQRVRADDHEAIHLTAGEFHLFVYLDCPDHGAIVREMLDAALCRISISATGEMTVLNPPDPP